MNNNRKVVLWFRNDLRLHDNEALQEAISNAQELYPIYVFDERVFQGSTKYGFRKTDVFRAKFIIESIHDLRNSLRHKGSNLMVRIGKPEEVLFDIAKELKTSWIFCNRERTDEEKQVQDKLEQELWTVGQEIRYSRGKMLYYTADLPFPVTHAPEIFTQFRKEVEKFIPIREPFDIPERLPVISDEIEFGQIPTLADLGFSDEDIERAEGTLLQGGETAGLERLDYYLWKSDHISEYKETRNGLLGMDYSSKLSSYLSHGCVSPKMVYAELSRYEKERIKNKSTYWLYFELLWRDFFRLMGKKHGNDIFKKHGLKRKRRDDLSDDMALFRVWAEARTGVPFIDAAMLELNTTGFMSNRSRQNVASFLVNDLNVNWQIGAEYFESLLIDYDPCSNWCNWNYVAGVGNDPREGRYFNTIKQAQRYDPDGAFVKHWLPQLDRLDGHYVHQPYLLSEEQQDEYQFTLGKDYPKVCVKLP
ncbi:MAG: DASH family cryptochrome [Bacteroidota bacterium]